MKKKEKQISKKTQKALQKNEQEMDAAHVGLIELEEKAQRIRIYDAKGKTVADRVLCPKHAPPFIAEAKKNKQKTAAIGEFDVSKCEQCQIDAYEKEQEEEDFRYGAHIHIGKDGECFFRLGDVSVPVEGKNPDHDVAPASIIKCLSGLLDSQVAQLAMACQLPIKPFVRELVIEPLVGLVQLIWYRDVVKKTSDHLKKNQEKRIAKYHQLLSEYVPEDESSPTGDDAVKKPRKQRTVGVARADKWTRSFKFLAATKDVAKGREAQLLEVMKKLKQATFTDIVKAAEGKVETKQKLDVIVDRFLKELITHKAVEEVK
jgi:hypothetical protein